MLTSACEADHSRFTPAFEKLKLEGGLCDEEIHRRVGAGLAGVVLPADGGGLSDAAFCGFQAASGWDGALLLSARSNSRHACTCGFC